MALLCKIPTRFPVNVLRLGKEHIVKRGNIKRERRSSLLGEIGWVSHSLMQFAGAHLSDHL